MFVISVALTLETNHCLYDNGTKNQDDQDRTNRLTGNTAAMKVEMQIVIVSDVAAAT